MSTRLTVNQLRALRIADEFDRVIQARRDGYDHVRPDHAPRTTLESLRVRSLLTEYEGPRYMPVYLLTEAGRKALEEHRGREA